MRYYACAALFVVALSLQVFAYNRTQFALESLRSHNDYRRKHGVPELQLSENLNAIAQEWASKLASEGRLHYRPNNTYGENILLKKFRNPNGANATDLFYSEIEYYDFNSERFAIYARHFTQLVWRGSRELGVGIAQYERNRPYYVVTEYFPPGNIPGEFEENVPKRIIE